MIDPTDVTYFNRTDEGSFAAKIFNRPLQDFNIMLEESNCLIAFIAQCASNLIRRMAMVDIKLSANPFGWLAANATTPILSRDNAIVISERYSVFSPHPIAFIFFLIGLEIGSLCFFVRRIFDQMTLLASRHEPTFVTAALIKIRSAFTNTTIFTDFLRWKILLFIFEVFRRIRSPRVCFIVANFATSLESILASCRSIKFSHGFFFFAHSAAFSCAHAH